jgi:predicted phage terminase large subunit-like protein
VSATLPRDRALTDFERAKLSPAGLARLGLPGYKLQPPHDLLNRVVMLASAAAAHPHEPQYDPYRRFIVAMPPRTGKSELTSVNGPAWHLGLNPHQTVGVVSYEATIAEDFSAKARDTIAAFGPQVFGLNVDPSSEARDHWSIVSAANGQRHRGQMWAMGWSGPMIGKGFNLLIIDDPVKNSEEALSPISREKLKDWWQAVSKTRLEPGAAVIIVMQRWHEDDLAGYVMREEGLYENVGLGGWTAVVLPLIAERITAAHIPGLTAERADPLGREDGALLPTRYSDKEIMAQQRTTPAFWWNANRQQRPSVKEGTLFTRTSILPYEVLPQFYKLYKTGPAWLVPRNAVRLFATTDLAASLKTKADFFSVGIWAVTQQKDLLLLDVRRGKYEGPDQDSILETTWVSWRPYGLMFIGIESTAYQLTMVQRMRRKGMAIHELKAKGDKYSRAITAAIYATGEKLFVPAAPVPWKAEYVNELLNYPNAAHDDQVDMTSYAVIAVEMGVGSGNIRLVG